MANRNNASEKDESAPEELKYTKESVLKLPQYRGRRDLLSVLLEDGKAYTFEEVSKEIDNFMKGTVK